MLSLYQSAVMGSPGSIDSLIVPLECRIRRFSAVAAVQARPDKMVRMVITTPVTSELERRLGRREEPGSRLGAGGTR